MLGSAFDVWTRRRFGQDASAEQAFSARRPSSMRMTLPLTTLLVFRPVPMMTATWRLAAGRWRIVAWMDD